MWGRGCQAHESRPRDADERGRGCPHDPSWSGPFRAPRAPPCARAAGALPKRPKRPASRPAPPTSSWPGTGRRASGCCKTGARLVPIAFLTRSLVFLTRRGGARHDRRRFRPSRFKPIRTRPYTPRTNGKAERSSGRRSASGPMPTAPPRRQADPGHAAVPGHVRHRATSLGPCRPNTLVQAEQPSWKRHPEPTTRGHHDPKRRRLLRSSSPPS